MSSARPCMEAPLPGQAGYRRQADVLECVAATSSPYGLTPTVPLKAPIFDSIYDSAQGRYRLCAHL